MKTAFDDFDQRQPKYLQRIEVWIFQQNLLSDFQQHLSAVSQSKPQQQQSMFGKVKSFLGFSGKSSDLIRY